MRKTLLVLAALTAGCTQDQMSSFNAQLTRAARESPSSRLAKDTEMVLFSKLEDTEVSVHNRPSVASTWDMIPVGTKVRVVNDAYEEGPGRWLKVSVIEGKNKGLLGFVTRNNLRSSP